MMLVLPQSVFRVQICVRSWRCIRGVARSPSFDTKSIPELPYAENISLAWKQLKPYKVKPVETKTPILFLHGLFGSKLSFNKVARKLSEITLSPAYAVDLRNHGESPHVLPHTYLQMAHDVYNFIKEREWESCILVGHSMGAKVAMLVSLLYPQLVEMLVVVDNSPRSMPLGDKFTNALLGMCEAEKIAFKFKQRSQVERVTEIKEIDEFLEQYIEDKNLRELVMSNLLINRKDLTNIHVKNKVKELFKIPVMNFWKNDVIGAMGEWPDLSVEKYEDPVLVIHGKKSDFVTTKDFGLFHEYFTNIQFKELDCGHWVSQEKPFEFVYLLMRFIQPDMKMSEEEVRRIVEDR
ncbi:hypothetical protein KGF56_002770 [Candida oxycetoniae]|uniref:AB hydrolase-1 domain-containing protein n=1 Tax=Candida oxycetoniae TaxID=497107 RepID=A0AAI9SWI0_9ASCO|nr:uncharacterized protein KGF56_002770 [Candida oxycetoniae]KAI3404373.2 hypothetical protein KGF56_002770 [Candida oxycetoniae]